MTSIVACLVLAVGAVAVILATHTPAKNEPITIPSVPGLSQIPAPSVAPRSSNPVDYIPSTLEHSWRVVETANDGSRIGLTVGIGSPERATKDQTTGTFGFTYDPSCGNANPATDAVLPIEIRMTNPTASALPLAYSFILDGYAVAGDVYIHYGDGPKCKNLSSVYAIEATWANGLGGGVDDESEMFLVMHDFYKLSAKDQRDSLAHAYVIFQPAEATTPQGDSTTMMPSRPVGPDVRGDGAIPLSG